MDRFKEKLLKSIRLCNEELANRKNGMIGESTEEKISSVICKCIYRMGLEYARANRNLCTIDRIK